MRRLLFVCGLAAFPASAFAAEPVWSRGGPEQGSITVLVTDPQHPATAYAGTLDGGIWVTTDGAAHWKAAYSGLPAISGHFAPIKAIAVDPAVASRVYAATQIGLYASEDGGATWSESGAGVLDGKFLNVIAIDPVSSSTVFAGTSGGVYLSHNAGASWSPSNPGLVDSGGQTPNVLSLAIDPNDSAGMVAGTNGAGTFGSTDGGATWRKFGGTSLDGVDVTNVVFDLGTPNLVYALSAETGLFRLAPPPTNSTAGVGIANPGWFKAFWEEVAIQAICGPSPCYGMLIVLPPPEPLGPQSLGFASAWPLAGSAVSEILIGTSGRGIYHSLDGGKTFTAINDGLPSLAISAIAGDASVTRYAGSGVAGVVRTTDDAHWTAANAGLFASEVYAVAASKSSPSIVYAATGSNLFKSSDAGLSWQNLSSIGIDQQVWPVLAVDPTNPAIVYAATDEKGVIKTTNGGSSWTPMQANLATTTIGAIAIDPASAQTIYAGTDEGIYKSTDGAGHWTLLNANLSSVHAIAIDPVSHQTLYAGGFGGVFRSTDGGTSWSRISGSNGFVDSSGTAGIAVDPSSHTNVYVADEQGIWRTSDGGASWNNLTAGLPDATLPSVSAVTIAAGTPSTIYVAYVGVIRGPGNGVYRSTNGGASWTAVEPGLDDSGVQALAISSGSTLILYAGSLGGGVFRSPPAAPPPPPAKRKIIPVHPAPPRKVHGPHG
jgi:photosystem II stability/assembly factor-like uncharacterized protein